MAAPEPPVHEHESDALDRESGAVRTGSFVAAASTAEHADTEMHAMPPVEPAIEAPAPLPETVHSAGTDAGCRTDRRLLPREPATDDLFSTPSTESAPLPVEEPATPSEAASDFLQRARHGSGRPNRRSATDPATEPVTTPAAAARPPTDDDLFAPPAEEAPAEEDAAGRGEATETDDLFSKTGTILRSAGRTVQPFALRHWVDNTGNFSCNGRMLRMLDGKVQLLKDNGRTTTVPLARLSQGDLEFVNRQASAQKAETLGKTAQVSDAWSN